VDHDRLHVVIGTDGSPAAREAVDTLVSLTAPDRVEITVRSVVRTPDVAFAAYPGGTVPTRYLDEALAEARHAAGEGLERTLERLRAAGFAAQGSLGGGWPATDLLDRAERDEADLVVVGARGIGRIERVAMGSVSAHVARHAPATLVAHAEHPFADRDRVDEPDGDVRASRYAVRWR
jgi:nucleotide-binding universal stress UspA family protein